MSTIVVSLAGARDLSAKLLPFYKGNTGDMHPDIPGLVERAETAADQSEEAVVGIAANLIQTQALVAALIAAQ